MRAPGDRRGTAGRDPREERRRWPGEAGSARCKIECLGGCACVYVWETNQCTCECFGDGLLPPTRGLALGTRIDITVAGLPLGPIAVCLDRLVARDVLVPASRVDTKVNLRLKRVTFSAAIKALGLSTRPRVGR